MRLRSSGVLLHISSLASPHGIGDLGPEAHAFARMLGASGQSAWQFLPLTPTSPALGNSPYSSPSAFAGNTLFISPESLLAENFVTQEEMDEARAEAAIFPSPTERAFAVDFHSVAVMREVLLRKAFERNRLRLETDASFKNFVDTNHYWLQDYARFVTLKETHGGTSWTQWPEHLAKREAHALVSWDASAAEAMQRVRFSQYLFSRQWKALQRLCKRLGIRLIGDAPIYVTHDSADVWANPHLFQLDWSGNPTAVAGVPPDYFSPTGQRWGNPLYDWGALERDGFQWWVRRMEHTLSMFDYVRLDHFRGFAGYWEVPVQEATAVNGRWVEAPGDKLLQTLTRRLIFLPLIAEDLGVITPDVRELQRTWDLPGMAVLQFGFNGNLWENPHAPFMHTKGQVVYTGTHDNAPSKGWFADTASSEEKEILASYVGHDVHEDSVSRVLTRLGLGSVANLAITPVQDILGLGMEARMNTPSTVEGNWTWRLLPGQLTPEAMQGLEQGTAFFGRHAGRRE